MSGPKPSTIADELPDAPPAVPESVGISRDDAVACSSGVPTQAVPESVVAPVSGGAAVALTFDAPLLPSSQDDLDTPLSKLLGDSGQCTVDSAHGGEGARPPEEKEKEMPDEIVPGVGVTSTSSPRFTRFLPDFAETFSKLESARTTVQGEFLGFDPMSCSFLGDFIFRFFPSLCLHFLGKIDAYFVVDKIQEKM